MSFLSSHGSEYDDNCFVECQAMYFDSVCLTSFQYNYEL